MSDDLVKRLRDWSEYDEGKINDAREEAADRIEALEAALRKIGEGNVCVLVMTNPAHCGRAYQARVALAGEKKDD